MNQVYKCKSKKEVGEYSLYVTQLNHVYEYYFVSLRYDCRLPVVDAPRKACDDLP
jgi:hypothetical protein